MISLSQVHDLIERAGDAQSPVLSLYLSADPSLTANLGRGYEKQAKALLTKLKEHVDGSSERSEFEADAAKVMDFLAGHSLSSRGVVLFCDASRDFFWSVELQTPVASQIVWEPEPYVRPLLEQLDEFERYGVILTDRNHGRLFSIFMGEITEHEVTLAPGDVRRVKSSGSDHWRSQMQFQRRGDQNAQWHLKSVVEETVRLTHELRLDRLVLAGPTKTTSHLKRLLPKRLQNMVVASIQLPVDAAPKEVLVKTLEIEMDAEREWESELVDSLITSAAKGEGAVIGLEPTLDALRDGRLSELVYAEGYREPGYECPQCRALAVNDGTSACGLCGGPLTEVSDLVSLAATRAVELGGKIELVRGRAADELNKAGRIGALLRF